MTIGDYDNNFIKMEILWNAEKNALLMETRQVSFEMVLDKIINGDFIGPEIHPTRKDQFRIIVDFEGYPFIIPLVIDADGNWFLKTIYPSRKEKRRKRK